MPTPQERLNAAIKFFFEDALPAASGKKLDQLPGPLVHPGAYTRAAGTPVASSYGQTVTTQFVLRVQPPLPAGATPQVTAEIPQTGGHERPLLYLRQAADHKVDTEEAIQKAMADLDSFSAVFNAEAAQTDDASPAVTPDAAAVTAAAAVARAADWARAIAGARGSVPDDLTTLSSVPAAFASLAPDAEALRTVLAHFFTFDANGKYYARWAAAGRDGSNPAHLSADYKRENVRELVLDRECVYLYAVVPASLLSPGGSIEEGVFREIVIRFDETAQGIEPFSLATVHSARWRRNDAPYCDFVFVYTTEGRGIQQTRDAREKMSPLLQSLMEEIDVSGADRESILSARPFTHKLGNDWFITLTVRLADQASLPEGALTADGSREWNTVTAPLAMVGPIAALPGVSFVGVTTPARAKLDKARAEVNYPGLDTKIAADKRGGKGVIVGIIDTGIDGSHPAFGSRIVAVWDQAPPASITGKSPKDNNTDKAYASMNWGVELTRTSTPSNVTHSVDRKGHGTHVASIAAGQEVKDGSGNVLVPAGLAPNAGIVVVNAIEPIGAGAKSDWSLGVDYILQKAKEANCPCVINMSFGHHNHGHDGSDTDARKILDQLTDKSKNYLPGRVVVAAAGNERNDSPMHVRRSVPKGGGTRRLGIVSLGSEVVAPNLVDWEGVTVWIRNPFNACPKTFPVSILLYRIKTSTTFDVTEKVTLGNSKLAGTFAALNTRIFISSVAAESINGDYSFQISFVPIDGTKTMVKSDWRVLIDNQVDAALDVHMWIFGGESSFKDAVPGDRAFLVGAPADGAAAISIAACATKLSWTDSSGNGWSNSSHTLHDLASFSSMGPLREASIPMKRAQNVAHEVNAVDVTAPGALTLAALSSQWTLTADEAKRKVNARGILLAGTSMASPLVTGLVANLLAEDATLTMPKVLEKLKQAASIPAASKFQPPKPVAGAKPYSQDWGYGLVDASKLK